MKTNWKRRPRESDMAWRNNVTRTPVPAPVARRLPLLTKNIYGTLCELDSVSHWCPLFPLLYVSAFGPSPYGFVDMACQWWDVLDFEWRGWAGHYHLLLQARERRQRLHLQGDTLLETSTATRATIRTTPFGQNASDWLLVCSLSQYRWNTILVGVFNTIREISRIRECSWPCTFSSIKIRFFGDLLTTYKEHRAPQVSTFAKK